DPQPALLEVPRAALRRPAEDRDGAARPPRLVILRRGRDTDRCDRARDRQRHLRRHRHPPPFHAPRPKRREGGGVARRYPAGGCTLDAPYGYGREVVRSVAPTSAKLRAPC